MRNMFVIMGVAASGKTTIGKMLSAITGLPFLDADDFHSVSNKEKMKDGLPLSDEDRAGWLESLHLLLVNHQQSGIILACSALKNGYRSKLSEGIMQVQWIFLKGSYELVQQRLEKRSGHYFNPALLVSQFAILEEPDDAFVLDIQQEPHALVFAILHHYNLYTDFGILGLGVMGKSLALNLAEKGYKISLFNLYIRNKEERIAVQFINSHPSLSEARGFENIQNFIYSLAKPRKLLIMVNAGSAMDEVMSDIKPFLEVDDIVIDGGNSFYKDTEQRMDRGIQAGYHFLGAGISGGEEGALKGPSIMAGGSLQAYQLVAPILTTIAAKDRNGMPCCTYVSSGGSGHFVKMVHNAIEYGEMQLLSEVYEWMRKGMSMQQDAIAAILAEWNQTSLNSYLLEITIDILLKKENEEWLLEKITDISYSKGTGIWSVATAAELGVPAGMFNAALNARFLSAGKQVRTIAAARYSLEQMPTTLSIQTLRDAYSLARIINHLQGFDLIKKAASVYGWQINLSELARIWTNGCIIRSSLMEQLKEIATDEVLILHSLTSEAIHKNINALRSVVAEGVISGLSIPAFSEALQYIYAMTTSESAINLIQAQRDYFGSHTYQRKDDPGGKAYHTQWK